MKIDHIETLHLRYPYPAEKCFKYAGGTCTGRLTSLVLVHTDGGKTGVGAAYSHPGLVELVVKHQLEPLLKGRDPREVETLWDFMYRLTRWYGRKGAALTALGGIDTALWDLRGQAAGQPVWKLLGGTRPACPAYASALLWNTLPALAAEARGHIDRGFRRVKMRLARSEEYDTSAVEAVRQAIGPDHDLMADASMRYDLPLARRIGKVLAANKVFWYEEPFQPEDFENYSLLRGTVGVPLAAGENEFGLQGFRELIRERAVNIVQPDACRAGGISEVVRVGQAAAAAGLRVATHTWSDAPTVIANAHAVSAMPNGVTVEIDQTGNPFIDELLAEPLRVIDGQLQLSQAPGLGIELNRTVVDRYRLSDSFNIPPGNYSDMLFGPEHYTPGPAYETRKP
ncbi:MAG: mandelate racemase/muconate lactonizing enzyme family protein [Pirellulales bacterium]